MGSFQSAVNIQGVRQEVERFNLDNCGTVVRPFVKTYNNRPAGEKRPAGKTFYRASLRQQNK